MALPAIRPVRRSVNSMKISGCLLAACASLLGVATAWGAAAAQPQPAVLAGPHGLAITQKKIPVLRRMNLMLRPQHGPALGGRLVAVSAGSGKDRAGAYTFQSFGFSRAVPTSKPAVSGPAATLPGVRLEIRYYPGSRVYVGILGYQGIGLKPRGAIRYSLVLSNFGRGLAMHRYSLWWTEPVFTSQYRDLPNQNQMLLWRQMRGAGYKRLGYHLLVPLAGDGMMGELGARHAAFRISFSSGVKGWLPQRVPLFAFGTGRNPYQLARRVYTAGFAAGHMYGRLRWQKTFPTAYRYLGWCSWNTYYQGVTAAKVRASIAWFEQHHIPLGFVLVDDGWLTQTKGRLEAYGAVKSKFPGGLKALVSQLRQRYHIPYIGVWHAFNGYWRGVDPTSAIGHAHVLLAGPYDLFSPEPATNAGEAFYSDWYQRLRADGINFLKVDDQASAPIFAGGRLPVFAFGQGQEMNLQRAARTAFPVAAAPHRAAGINLLNCMDMSLENVYNWRNSDVGRNSDDYVPGSPYDSRRHIFDNAYNAYWFSNFAVPDWDMFESAQPDARLQAIARAISGGPIYTTDPPRVAKAAMLRALALANGLALRPNRPAEVVPAQLLRNPAASPIALQVFAPVHRPGLQSEMVAAFNVNFTHEQVTGTLSSQDAPDLRHHGGMSARPALAVYERNGHHAFLLAPGTRYQFHLGALQADLFSLVPVRHSLAVFGLLNKYMGEAAVETVRYSGSGASIRLAQGGEFGAWLLHAPRRVWLGKKLLGPGEYHYARHLLVIPATSFGTARIPVTVGLQF